MCCSTMLFSVVHNAYCGAEGYAYKQCGELPSGQHAHIIISSQHKTQAARCICRHDQFISFILPHYYFLICLSSMYGMNLPSFFSPPLSITLSVPHPRGEGPVGLEANLKPINTGLCFFLCVSPVQCPCLTVGRERGSICLVTIAL